MELRKRHPRRRTDDVLWSLGTEVLMRFVTVLTLLALALVAPAGRVQAKTVRSPKAASKTPASKKPTSEQIVAAFQTFCQEWMQKLAVREHDNIANIKWHTGPDGVQGEYVGYTQDHTCVVKNEDKDPVGKIAYQEVRYEKRGATIAEAEKNLPHPLETTAVTELFRYEGGKWIY
jgi:hypothetical protein